MRSLRAIVFDVDGTLLDTKEFIAQAFDHTLTTHGFPIPERTHLMRSVAGKHLKDCYPLFAPGADLDTLFATHRAFQFENFHLIRAYDGLHAFLGALRERGIRLGICSSRAKTVKPSLEHLQALSYFDVVIDATEVQIS